MINYFLCFRIMKWQKWYIVDQVKIHLNILLLTLRNVFFEGENWHDNINQWMYKE